MTVAMPSGMTDRLLIAGSLKLGRSTAPMQHYQHQTARTAVRFSATHSSSTAKTIPPIGALNVAATASKQNPQC